MDIDWANEMDFIQFDGLLQLEVFVSIEKNRNGAASNFAEVA